MAATTPGARRRGPRANARGTRLRWTRAGRRADARLQPDLSGGSDVEKERALFGAAPPRDQRREAVAGEAQMPPRLDAVMAVLGRKMGNTRDQSPNLRKLRHTFIHAGSRVALVVHDDEQVQARRAPRSPQDSLLSPPDWRRRPEAGTRKRRKVLLSRRRNLVALSVLTVNVLKRRYEMCALPEARPLLSLLAQRAAPSRPLSTWLTPASYRPAACQPIKSLHHVIDDAQRTERT